jgi:hypothetical protein
MTEQDIRKYIEDKGFTFRITKKVGTDNTLIHYFTRGNLIMYFYLYENCINPAWTYSFPEMLLCMGLNKEDENLTQISAMSIYDRDINDPMNFDNIEEALFTEEKIKLEDFYNTQI